MWEVKVTAIVYRIKKLFVYRRQSWDGFRMLFKIYEYTWTEGLLRIQRYFLKGPRCFLEQETLPLLLSTGWFQERIRA